MKQGMSEEMLRTLCIQLFSLGVAEDSLLIWDAKQSSFDAGCGLDVQFLCGAGLEATKEFLSGSASTPAFSNCWLITLDMRRSSPFSTSRMISGLTIGMVRLGSAE